MIDPLSGIMGLLKPRTVVAKRMLLVNPPIVLRSTE